MDYAYKILDYNIIIVSIPSSFLLSLVHTCRHVARRVYMLMPVCEISHFVKCLKRLAVALCLASWLGTLGNKACNIWYNFLPQEIVCRGSIDTTTGTRMEILLHQNRTTCLLVWLYYIGFGQLIVSFKFYFQFERCDTST